ncbi:hypothetical protein [Nakamurella lactea]|uniref:hypothetical protein n=1 Tax=Nakamurella lactea TaxID=459515 RepID=UPI0012B63030|nr:hypothetical protein [Nakamurella lactea]
MDLSFIDSKSGCQAALSVANCRGPDAGTLQSGAAPPEPADVEPSPAPELSAGSELAAALEVSAGLSPVAALVAVSEPAAVSAELVAAGVLAPLPESLLPQAVAARTGTSAAARMVANLRDFFTFVTSL